MTELQLQIVTPMSEVFSGPIHSIVSPGAEGYFGVLPRHAPMLALLQVGEIRVELAATGEKRRFATSGGFVEVSPQKVTVLAEAAEERATIDVQRAEAAKDRALKRISEGRETWDLERAQAALARALNRLQVAARKA